MNKLKILIFMAMFSIFNSYGQNSNKINKFWVEIQKNESSINNLPSEQKLDNLNGLLQKISKGLACEISVNQSTEKTKQNIVITANGNKNLFSLVDSIIELSYKSKIWNFIALRQKNPDYIGFEYNDTKLLVDGMAFIPIDNEKGLGVKFIVFDKGIKINKEFIEIYGPTVIDYLVGEREFAQEIIAYDFYLKSEINETKAIPLRKINFYLEKRREFHKNND